MTDLLPVRCRTCRDAGWVRADVPVGDPDFGKPIRCGCNPEQPREEPPRIDQRRSARERRWGSR